MHQSTHRLSWAAAALIVCSAVFAQDATGAVETDGFAIEPFSASYHIDIGLANGRSSLELKPLDGGRYEIVSVTEAKGIASWFKRGQVYERAVFRVEDGKILAESMMRRDTLSSEERSCELYYRPEMGEADIVYNGERRTVEIPPNTFNPLLMQVALMQDLANGQPPEFYNILDYVGLAKYSVTVKDKRDVKTPVGAFATVPVDLINEARGAGTRVFTSPDKDWIAVMVEARKDDDVKATLKLNGTGDNAEMVASAR